LERLFNSIKGGRQPSREALPPRLCKVKSLNFGFRQKRQLKHLNSVMFGSQVKLYVIRMPSKPHSLTGPDKLRISIDSGTIPYSFDSGLGC
jgi:hypothetical protein